MTLLTAARRPGLGRAPAPLGVLLAMAFLAVLLVAALAPWLFSPVDPLLTSGPDALRSPSAAHPFGTDQSGRDVFARVLWGARYSLIVGFGATLSAVIAGLIIGVASGLAPRWLDGAIARAIEVLMAFPEFLVALVVIAITGPGEVGIIVAVAFAALPAYARVARVETLVIKRAGFVRSARALGVPAFATVARHIVPNMIGPLIVMATIGVGTAIVSAAGLSFLGLGPVPPTPEWGVILSEGRNFLNTAWWIAVFPGLTITITVIATNTVGRWLRTRTAGRAR